MKQKMNLTITRLGPEDLNRAAANCALFWDMFDFPQRLEEFLRDKSNILLVAEVDGKPVGQVLGYILKRWDAKPSKLFLYSIDVLESHRLRGIGRNLIDRFRQIGRECGCTITFVITNESNLPAMGLYQTTGAKRNDLDDVVLEWTES